MLIETIREKINALKAILPRQPEALRDTQFKDVIILNYIQQVINRLEAILRNSQGEIALSEDFKRFLKDNWELVKGSLLAYTALPNEPITQLLCAVAEYVAEYVVEYIDEKEKTPAISFLMPSIACDSISPAKYRNLDEMGLAEVLQTHVLGKDSTYLIPISLLAKEEIDLAEIHNPYFEVDTHTANSVFLSNEELKRLAEYSSETTALYRLREHFIVLSNDKANLLGKLNELIRGLGVYSVKGIGREEAAGEGGYALLVNFIEYWNDLNKINIPDTVKKEINRITQLSGDKNKIGNPDSCFATRRDDLRKAIKGNEEILAAISLNAEKKASAIEKIKREFDQNSTDLQQRLKSKKYIGQDRLGITAKIIDGLGVELAFANFSELTDNLKGLQAEDVRALCALQQAPEKIVKAIANVENLVMLASVELSDEVLSALLQGVKGKINLIIQSPEDFSSFLTLFDVDKCKLICASLNAELTTIIKDSFNFSAVLCNLNFEQCQVVCDALKEKISALVETINDFHNIIRYLNSEQCQVVCDAFKDNLTGIINNGADFSAVLCNLNPEQRTIVFEAFKEKIPALVKTRKDFSEIIGYLNSEQCQVVYEALKGKLPGMIKNANDFTEFLRILQPEQRTGICEVFKEKIPVIIKKAKHFSEVFCYLDFEQRKIVYEALKGKLPAIIKKANDFTEFLKILRPDQKTDMCAVLKRKLPKLIKKSKHFSEVFLYLGPEQRTIVYEALEGKLPAMIKKANDFADIFLYLNSEQRTVVYEALEGKLPAMIKSDKDLDKVLRYLNPEQRMAVCETSTKTCTRPESFIRYGIFKNMSNNQTTPKVLSSDLPIPSPRR